MSESGSSEQRELSDSDLQRYLLLLGVRGLGDYPYLDALIRAEYRLRRHVSLARLRRILGIGAA